ncbi:MAG: ribonuclease H-like domain-containing protein [Ignavibacteria bacterium]|nr:ribonuclease H-like domain-containing protein [Ignavibacteria bacterium]
MDIKKKKILVFDLEVAAYDYETHFDEETKEYLVKFAKNDEEKKAAIEALVFTPFTSYLVAIGLLDYNEKSGAVLVNAGADVKLNPEKRLASEKLLNFNTGSDENGKERLYEEEKLSKLTYLVASEKEMLEMFWQKIRNKGYNLFVTFNGREFDCPYIMLRSFQLGIKPSYNLMSGTDFNIKGYHIDLMKEMTFNKHSPTGARRKFSLDFYCKMLGIPSPKAEGVKGDMVSDLYNNGEYQKIADYCFGDVIATSNLFNLWNKYLDF